MQAVSREAAKTIALQNIQIIELLKAREVIPNFISNWLTRRVKAWEKRQLCNAEVF